jgi:hypothetical protein
LGKQKNLEEDVFPKDYSTLRVEREEKTFPSPPVASLHWGLFSLNTACSAELRGGIGYSLATIM